MVRFGPFDFDPATLDLRREGVDVHLQNQPKQVLACLVRNASRTVSREELRKAVWGDETFVDFDRGLNFCITQIRTALGDDAAQPTFIRTVARQGYQFIAPVESLQARRSTSWRLVTASVAFVVLAGVAFAVLHAHAKGVPVVAVVRFDNETGDPDMTRFSDGLTDNFVERLTTFGGGRYLVIGNAEILRRPREARNLNAIAASLKANFVILGQVQAYRGQTRILVHLIHMPEQTHVSVARLDRALTNPLAVEAEAAQKVAASFSQRVVNTNSQLPNRN